MNKKLIDFISPNLSEHRFGLFNKVIQDRTRYMTVALEDIYQPHNASAVLRTCDCFGVQDVHIIENKYQYTINPAVVVGSSKWLNLNKYNSQENNTLEAIETLKKQGYRIIATTPHSNDVDLQDFDVTKGKFALFFGSERPGLSELMLDNADEFLKIPMYGFTESFNISVSASIILHHLKLKMQTENIDWKLSEKDKNKTLIQWLLRSVNKPEIYLNQFNKQENTNIEVELYL